LRFGGPVILADDVRKNVILPEATFNIDKLALAVATHETGNCTLAGSSDVNNCFGIMSFRKDGSRFFKRYDAPEDSYKDFVRIWTKWYGEMPNRAMAVKWSGNDRAGAWLNNVTHFYNTL